VRRYISHDIETRLGQALLSGDVTDGSKLRIDVVDGDVKVEVDRPAETSRDAA
jgi:ATP-dependent Clp protease ATP-binding subunit ClpB